MIILKLVGFIWLLPATILYWVFYIFPLMWKDIRYVGKSDTFVWQFTLVSRHSWYAKIWRDWAGFSGPCVIVTRVPEEWYDLYSREEVMRIRARIALHELRHCWQRFVFGIFWDPVYIIFAVCIKLFTKRHSHLDHPFERDARRYAGELVEVPREYWPDGPKDQWPWW